MNSLINEINSTIKTHNPGVEAVLLKCPAFGDSECMVSFSGDGHEKAAAEWATGSKGTVKIEHSQTLAGVDYTYSTVTW